ncbi:homeobox protein GBX-2 isoform X2 [Mus caroli]|uniref:Homeobox protein GBX-2 isoform X2 n=1 Tax=Mus caroli TaxID=10089 RepID=A0A6P5QCX2_MUSCR|nr:homeobox protein GBX-2 isoform X2 [Mus caroli]
MSAAFPPSLMMMQRPLGSSTAFSIDSLIGSPPQPSPGHFVYTGYPMFMPYRPVVLPPPPPPPPALPQAALQPALPPAHPHHQIPSLPTGFCSSLAQGMALTSTLMATLPGGFSASPQHQEAAAARKFAPQPLPGGGNFDKAEALQADAEDGKAFLAKEGSLLAFSAAEAVQASLGESAARAAGTRGREGVGAGQLRSGLSEGKGKTSQRWKMTRRARRRASLWRAMWITARMTICLARLLIRKKTPATHWRRPRRAAVRQAAPRPQARTGGGGLPSPVNSCWSWRKNSTAKSTSP